jgi:hypothetical protein
MRAKGTDPFILKAKGENLFFSRRTRAQTKNLIRLIKTANADAKKMGGQSVRSGV